MGQLVSVFPGSVAPENILMELSRVTPGYRNVQGCHLAFGRAMLGLV